MERSGSSACGAEVGDARARHALDGVARRFDWTGVVRLSTRGPSPFLAGGLVEDRQAEEHVDARAVGGERQEDALDLEDRGVVGRSFAKPRVADFFLAGEGGVFRLSAISICGAGFTAPPLARCCF